MLAEIKKLEINLNCHSDESASVRTGSALKLEA